MSLDAVTGTASAGIVPLLSPHLLEGARTGPALRLDFDRVASTLFNAEPARKAAAVVELCTEPDRLLYQYEKTVKSDRAQIFDARQVVTAGSKEPLWLILFSRDALTALLADGTAEWHVAVLDARHQRLAETRFETVRPAEMTLDGVGARLRLQHGLVHAHVAFGCAAKNGERFDVPIQLASALACARAHATAFPPLAYPAVTPQADCAERPVVTTAAAPRGGRYEATQGQWAAWSAMPYIEEDVAAVDADWARIASILAPRAAERRLNGSEETLANAVAVGSLPHTTARWSHVRGDQLRLHQLMPIRDAAGKEAYLALYSRASPREALSRSEAEWRVALVSPGYEVESDAAFLLRPPAAPAGGYRAVQTSLELEAGQPVARIRYLSHAPAPLGTPSAALPLAEFRVELALDLAQRCLSYAGHELVGGPT